VSHKSAKIAAMIAHCQGRDLDAHYLGYFECFNQQLFYEAHDVLEELWLAQRGQPNDLFYKGLIQLAGAFVHLQKNRLKPADALFGLAEKNLGQYPQVHEQLDLAVVLTLAGQWRKDLARLCFSDNPYRAEVAPRLMLLALENQAG
jgi:predicted metal-dependent hydrolase